MIEEFIRRFKTRPDATAVIAGDEAMTYGELLGAMEEWDRTFGAAEMQAGDVVLLKGDFSLSSTSALLALLKTQAIVILLAPSSYEKEAEFSELGRPQWVLDAATGRLEAAGFDGQHPLYTELRERGEPGIVLFSSGSSGVSKGTVHSAKRLLDKFNTKGKDFRTLAFLLFDHIAGLDTLFYSLANLSVLVIPHERNPDRIAELIETHDIEVLPTAPSFLNVFLLSGAHERHDLSSLKIITYGSEMMPQETLERCAGAFPNARIIQKYGTSEIGALPTRSKSNTSRWLQLGGDGYEWRVRDGLFEVRAKTAMLGYLNAPSPFTDDGFFMTGDRVEVDGDYVRFLGRDSDVINVGGQKVFPAEVENLLRQLPDVAEVSVYGERHAILGAAVVAKIRPHDPNLDAVQLRQTVRRALAGKIEPYKIPQKLLISSEALTTARFKQIRKSGE